MIIDTLIEKIDEKRCPVVVGLDPLIQKIPSYIQQNAVDAYGNTTKAAAKALLDFNIKLLDAIHHLIPAVKLQMACYEIYGADGLDAFYKTVDYAREKGLVVIDDSKRNDIGSTAALYAKGHIGQPPLITGTAPAVASDFITVSPYMGSDTINPFLDECKINEKGIFVLVRTSNASAQEYQEAMIDGLPLYQKIAKDMQVIADDYCGTRGFSPVGAVVGATWPQESETLRNLMPNIFFLVPGFGAQGATAEDVMSAFNSDGWGAVINSSRGIIFAYLADKYKHLIQDESDFTKASVKAVEDMKEELLAAMKKKEKLPKGW